MSYTQKSIISRTPWSSRLHPVCGVMMIKTYVFLVFVLSLHNLHKHGPFAHANVSTLGEPAGMLYPWVVWRFPVLQSTATKETASAICIACKIMKIQTPVQSQLPSELSTTKYPPNPRTWNDIYELQWRSTALWHIYIFTLMCDFCCQTALLWSTIVCYY